MAFHPHRPFENLPFPSASGAPDALPREHDVCSLGPADLLDCLRLDRQSLGGLWSEEQWMRELADPKRPVVGCRKEGGLVALASAWLVVDELHITAVAVDPHHRRGGLGRKVLEELLDLARGAGAQRATLEVSSSNRAAQALYGALGFKEIAVRRAYYRNGEDALIQWLTL